MLLVDEASNQKGSGVGKVLEGPNGSNPCNLDSEPTKTRPNILARMRLAKELGAQMLTAKSDS
ncbi:hypothetical protein CR513_51816, partial [Mucuna pruriens]